MKQLLQTSRDGGLEVVEVPQPMLGSSGILVGTIASVISPGTERAAREFASRGLVGKALSRPDLVREVLIKARRDGLAEAVSVALSRLDRPTAPGYACAGVVLAVAPGVDDFAPGDAVACSGAGYATHADVNYVPRNLAVRIPRRPGGQVLPFDQAAFGTLGAIALQAVRLATPQLGDRAVVIGLGPIGILVAQILRANGCDVLGVDTNDARCATLRGVGVTRTAAPADAPSEVERWSGGLGADLVIVAASSPTSEPVVLAASLARLSGRVVAVGDTRLDLPRRQFFDKELSFIVSRSYGPGRYDRAYEELGQDYPLPYVRWTERENLAAFLDLVADGRVNVSALITHRFPRGEAVAAYGLLGDPGTLGIVLEYPGHEAASASAARPTRVTLRTPIAGSLGVSVVGAGRFANAVLLPALAKCSGVSLRGVVSAGGLSARTAARSFGFVFCTSDPGEVWRDAETRAVVIATRHAEHASMVGAAIRAGKAVFVEKPLCTTPEELNDLEALYAGAAEPPLVMVGFNRRFAPATRRILEHFAAVSGPLNIICRVNAGSVPRGSWVASPEHGGRIVGELCHFVDLCAVIARSRVRMVQALRTPGTDDVAVTLSMANGSLASIAYCCDGDRSFSKERIEVFGGSRVAVIDDFRGGVIVGHARRTRLGGLLQRQDKGHSTEIAAFVDAALGHRPNSVPFAEAVAATRATFAVLDALACAAPVTLDA